jgi:hypothetical protein
VKNEFELLAAGFTLRPLPSEQIVLLNNPEVFYLSMRELPVELLAEIFEFAIEDSPLQDPVYDSRHQRSAKTNQILWNSHSSPHKHGGSVDLSGNATSSPDSRQDLALNTKLAIASTSSQWRKIGLPYLFRTVTFVSLRQLQVFTGLVRGSRYRYVAGPHNIRLLIEGKGTGYGSLIRRLETEIDRKQSFLIALLVILIIFYSWQGSIGPYHLRRYPFRSTEVLPLSPHLRQSESPVGYPDTFTDNRCSQQSSHSRDGIYILVQKWIGHGRHKGSKGDRTPRMVR